MKVLVKSALAVSVAIAGLSGPVRAADVPVDPVIVPAPLGGLYILGFVGLTNQDLDGLDNVLFANGIVQFVDPGAFDASPYFGGGIGYRFNNWFRADVTGEYRTEADFTAADRYDFNLDGIWDGTNWYGAGKHEVLFLANAYVDLGTWAGITPYVGAGIGTSRNTISGFSDYNQFTGTYAVAQSHSQWELAWAIHAGVGIDLAPGVSFDIGYRYVDLGDAQSGDIVAIGAPNTVYNPMLFNGLTSHDVYLGLRYALN